MNVVIGGSGFVGNGIVQMLRERGESVRVIDIAPHPDPDIESVVGDVRDGQQVQAALQGAETVYHTASYIFIGLGRPQHVIDININGTRNVIAACKANGVRKLIYTSSAEVVLGYDTPIADGDETVPYPTRFASLYGETKATAEQLILTANRTDGLLTCALRPNGIYGKGDKYQTPAIMDFVQQKRFIRLGDGRARALQTYIDNCSHAHLLAADRMEEGSPVGGQAYFIGDGECRNHFDFFQAILHEMGFELPTQSIPVWLALVIARSNELKFYATPERMRSQPLLNRHTIAATCTPQSFRLDKARQELGYEPLVTHKEGI
ncbi:MAG: NAD-dependent epimerase/dehydratase family protein, partial [Anaerolineae bacterium]|nr:NAD-dependent epimerase/dehydratase family protein [Anaerolineae bacterium]